MINELGLINNFSKLRNYVLVLYGAGRQGERIVRELNDRGITVSFFCDSQMQKWGLSSNGIKIISPTRLKELDREEEVVIIITIESILLVEQSMAVLRSLGLRTNRIATLFGLDQALKQKRASDNEHFIEKWVRIERTCRLRQEWRLNHLKNFMSANNILIYQPGKVGSQTICSSFLNAGIIDSFLSGHLHTLNYTEMEATVKEAIAMKLESMKAMGKIKIITLVREPIARDLSFIFEVMERLEEETAYQTESFIDFCSRRLKKIAFNGDFLFGRPSHDYGFQFEWFDNELKAVFGIDIFEYPFDREKGYSVISQAEVEVLVLKLEKIDNLEQVIGDFVGKPDFKLSRYNEGGDKRYKYLYANVKSNINILPEIVSLYYENNARMNHFYTEEEKQVFLKEWSKNIY
jgi:hypothetical protein